MSLTKVSSAVLNVDDLYGFRNRIINGDMRIDQRNAGASVTQQGTTQYCLDRWQLNGEATDGVFTAQQDATAPAEFNNSLKITVTTADASIGAAQRYQLNQSIEGFNAADLNWGTASAQTVTLSFWVRSSVTGTFGGSLRASGGTRTYPYSYTISAANTWEYKTITIAGDTTGTWLTNNGIGIAVFFSLGAGSNFLGTVNTWASADYRAPTGSVNLIATSGATFYVTGVQLEKGTVATPFERRPYGMELSLCQRYYQLLQGFAASSYTSTEVFGSFSFATEMRASSTVAVTAALSITYPGVDDYTQSSASASIVASRVTVRGVQLNIPNFSGLTSGRVYFHNVGVNNAAFAFSAEL
jgi:hypothetical protein